MIASSASITSSFDARLFAKLSFRLNAFDGALKAAPSAHCAGTGGFASKRIRLPWRTSPVPTSGVPTVKRSGLRKLRYCMISRENVRSADQPARLRAMPYYCIATG